MVLPRLDEPLSSLAAIKSRFRADSRLQNADDILFLVGIAELVGAGHRPSMRQWDQFDRLVGKFHRQTRGNSHEANFVIDRIRELIEGKMP